MFIRLLRHHVVVRVGGGWDTLEHYLATHARAGQQLSQAIGSGEALSAVRSRLSMNPLVVPIGCCLCSPPCLFGSYVGSTFKHVNRCVLPVSFQVDSCFARLIVL